MDEVTYSRDFWVHVHVKVSTHHEEEAVVEEHVHEHEEEAVHDEHVEEEAVFEGAEVTITVYDPEGNVFTNLRGITDQDGEVVFEVYIGPEDPLGAYAVIPEASFEGSPTVIGETSHFRVV